MGNSLETSKAAYTDKAAEKAMQNQTLQVEQMQHKAELLAELNTVYPETSANARQRSKLKSIISSPTLEFKGDLKKPDPSTIYDDLIYIKNEIELIKNPTKKTYLQRVYSDLDAVGGQYPNWGNYKQERGSNESKYEEVVGSGFKALISAGLAIKMVIDIANKNYGLAAIEGGLAIWISRLDKYIDPMRLHTNEVKFVKEKDHAFHTLQKQGVKGSAWSVLAQKYMGRQLSPPVLTAAEEDMVAQLGPVGMNKLRSIMKGVKSDSAKQTVSEWIEHSA